MIIRSIIYVNIFVNLIILASYFFPNTMFQIPYYNRVVAEGISSIGALQFEQTFYLLAPLYGKYISIINQLMIFTAILGALVSMFNCFMLLSNKIIKVFLFLPVGIFLIWDVVFPPGLDHWGFRFLYDVTDIINCILFGFFCFKKN